MKYEHGSFINEYATSSVEPQVGLGATLMYWSDREAYTIVRVSESGKTFWMQRDKARRTDGLGMTDAQRYEYEHDPEGEVRTVRLTKRGWRASGQKVVVGVRDEYYDYTF